MVRDSRNLGVIGFDPKLEWHPPNFQTVTPKRLTAHPNILVSAVG